MVTSTDELTVVEPAFVGDASQGSRGRRLV
jgi:hypothetical protein